MTEAPTKRKFPAIDALRVAGEIIDAIMPHCETIMIAGSLRRERAYVGDLEIVYIPKFEVRKTDMFSSDNVDLANEEIGKLLEKGIIAKRLNSTGSPSWGVKNKLSYHCASGVPVDLFCSSLPTWWNYLVCRTGGAESNKQICIAAQARRWKWNPYGTGFSPVFPDGKTIDKNREPKIVTSERDVFDFVGMKYREPKDRP